MGGRIIRYDSPSLDAAGIGDGQLRHGRCASDRQGALAGRVPHLILKLEEEGVGDTRSREIDQQRPIAITPAIITGTTLIHVDQVHAIARLELKILIFFSGFRPPAFAKGIHHGLVVVDRALQQIFHTFKQVIVRTRFCVDQWLEIFRPEQVAANVVDRSGFGRGSLDLIPAFRQGPGSIHNRMVEILHN
jgi:hypothetical protein